MMKYIRKKVVIEAVHWNGNEVSEIPDWIHEALNGGVLVRFGDKVQVRTLEGVMTASPGDYIIKGVDGELYPCKPDIFEKTYEKVGEGKESENLNFGEVIEILKQGGLVRRKGWNGKGLFVIKQVPAHIESDVIPRMQSLPQSAKDRILKGKGFVEYTSQCLIYNENTGRADSWVPSVSDIFAEDWEVVHNQD